MYLMCVTPAPGETLTANNCADPVTVEVGTVDLSYSMTISPTSTTAGGTVNVSGTVRNGGTIKSSAGVFVYGYLDSNDDPVFQGREYFLGLGAGATTRISATAEAPAGRRPVRVLRLPVVGTRRIRLRLGDLDRPAVGRCVECAGRRQHGVLMFRPMCASSASPASTPGILRIFGSGRPCRQRASRDGLAVDDLLGRPLRAPRLQRGGPAVPGIPDQGLRFCALEHHRADVRVGCDIARGYRYVGR